LRFGSVESVLSVLHVRILSAFSLHSVESVLHSVESVLHLSICASLPQPTPIGLTFLGVCDSLTGWFSQSSFLILDMLMHKASLYL
jgi:hypothetical protein